MKFKDLAPVITYYNAKRGTFSTRKSAAMMNVIALYESESNKEKDIPDVVIKKFLKQHWEEIRTTSRSYVNQASKPKATEQAFIYLAQLFENPSAPPSSYITISTLMPGPGSFTRGVNFNQPMQLVSGFLFHYGAFVDELKERVDIQHLTVMSDALKIYDRAAANDLRLALSKVVPSGNAQQRAELQKLQTVFTQLVQQFPLVRAIRANPAVQFTQLLEKVPAQYSFKTEENLEFDIRYLFFTNFENPITGKPLSDTDIQKAKQHALLGTYIAQFQTAGNIFVMSAEAANEAVSGGMFSSVSGSVSAAISNITQAVSTVFSSSSAPAPVFDLQNGAFLQALAEKRDGIAPPQRRVVTKRLADLFTLSEHFSAGNFLQAVPDNSPVKQVLTQFMVNSAAHKEKLRMTARKIPSRYSFKTADGIEFDMRDMFFNGFVSPITGKPFSDMDFKRLQKHPVLGNLIAQFHDMDNMFILPAGEGHHAVDFNTFDFKAYSESRDNIPLSRRQEVYAHMSALVEFSDHVNFENYLPDVPAHLPLKQNIAAFTAKITPLRKNIIWTEMDHAQFFLKARPVIDAMQREMGSDWDSSTYNFFAAMKEFSEKPEEVVKRAGGSYIRSNNEYVVRVDAIKKDVDAVRVLKELVGQFKRCFEVGYRDDALRGLVQGMTPSGICIAEKMLHLGQSFAVRESLGANRLGTFDDVFATVMAKARKYEIARGATWNGNDFLRYLMDNHKGKTAYIGADGKKQFISEENIRFYLRDIFGYDEVAAYVAPKTSSLSLR